MGGRRNSGVGVLAQGPAPLVGVVASLQEVVGDKSCVCFLLYWKTEHVNYKKSSDSGDSGEEMISVKYCLVII